MPSSKAVSLACIGGAFVGWSLMFAGIVYFQSQIGTYFMNYPLIGIGSNEIPGLSSLVHPISGFNASTSTSTTTTDTTSDYTQDYTAVFDAVTPIIIGLSQMLPNPLGETVSYAWWIVSFQLFMIILQLIIVLRFPKRLAGLANLTAVLTASTFLFTNRVFNTGWGVWAVTHDIQGNYVNPLKWANSKKYQYQVLWTLFKAGAVMFAGLITVNVFNAINCLTLYAPEEAPAATAEEKEGKAQNV